VEEPEMSCCPAAVASRGGCPENLERRLPAMQAYRSLAFLLVLGLAFLVPASIDAGVPPTVTILGETDVFVEFGKCKTVYFIASASFTPTAIDWTENGTAVATGALYSRLFCSPEKYYVYAETVVLKVKARITSEAAVMDTHSVRVIYEAGEDEEGCGQVIVCPENDF
jgi:hypothetical protein